MPVLRSDSRLVGADDVVHETRDVHRGLPGESMRGSTRGDDHPSFVPPPTTKGLEREFGVSRLLHALGLGEPATRCDRYVLQEKLGEGAMGIVYRAYDPELDREVAIKLLREGSHANSQARLRREARALARLNDPRVVQILAIGEECEQMWIAMELVPGETLAEWAARTAGEDARARTGRAIEILMEAGRGLAAAHAVALVHRDFKPANVLLGKDGRVKIADFGLAKRIGSATDENVTPANNEEATFGSTAIAGTPAYMAPEQHDRLPGDARCDQFAFAVVAWELLSGHPAFRADTMQGFARAKRKRRVENVASIPSRYRQPLLRALSPAPEDRFPDMDALLAALQRRPTRARWVWGLGAGLACVAATGMMRTPSPHPCAAVRAPTWDARARADLSSAFSRGGAVEVSDAWARLEQALDAHVDAWVRERDRACESLAPERAELVVGCLDRNARAFDEMVGIATADPKAALRGVEMLAELPRVDCTESAPREPDPELEAELTKIAVLRAAGAYGNAREALERIEPLARARGGPRDVARVLVVLGEEQQRSGEGEAALASFEKAHAYASESGDDPIAMAAALDAVEVLLEYEGSRASLRDWLRAAKVAYERQGRPASPEGVWVLLHESQVVDRIEGDRRRALELAHQALALAERLDAREHGTAATTRASTHEQLADLYFSAGDLEAAEIHVRAVIEWLTRGLGADHPVTRDRHSYIADVLAARGELEKAQAALGTALAGARAGGEGHATSVALLLIKSSTNHRRLGRHAQAVKLAQEALDMLQSRGASAELVVEAMAELAIAQQMSGDLEAAETTGERLVATLEAELGPEHPDLARALYNLAEVALSNGEHDRAEAHFRRSLAIAEASLGPEAPPLAYPMSGLAEVAMLTGRREVANDLLDRAEELAAQHDDPALRDRVERTRASATATAAVR